VKNYFFVTSILLLLLVLSLSISLNSCYSVSPQKEIVISSELNKYKFIPGESIILSGDAKAITTQNNTSSPPVPYVGWLNVKIYKFPDNLPQNYTPKDVETKGTLLHTKHLFTNGSINNFIFESPEIGKYIIFYKAYKEIDKQPVYRDVFEVVSPIYTNWGISFTIAILSVIGLIFLIMLSTRNIELTKFEIYRFISISGIILPIIFGLIFIDSEWGRNSPISILKFVDPSKEEQIGNQWIINIGGIKMDNYRSGIFIPVFVLIFGLAGGYLRFLHRTILQKDNVESLSQIDEYLFKWNDIPGNIQETNKLKQYLLTHYNVPWINNREFEKIADNENKIFSEDKKNNILISLNQNEEKIIIKVNDKVKGSLIARSSNDDILIYKRSDKKNWLFYQSLGDLTILIMAPLLAIAAWFILTTAGVYDKYVVATVSFAIGLITDNIVNRLISFSELAFKGK
jgi:hypothetical protein